MENNVSSDNDILINSLVGEGTHFKGDLLATGLLRIDGDFSGTIQTPGRVLVGKNGRAECVITAGTVVIGGIVKGNIFASEKVIILSTGMVVGNITTPRLIAEEGVVLNGDCKILKNNIASASSRELQNAAAQTGKGVYDPFLFSKK